MRGVPKTLIVVVAVLLLALGLAACGGGGDDSSSSSSAATTAQAENGSGEGGDAGDFVPKSHEDSGGGAEQFKTKGGDNSIQEFGEEAEGTELNDAAVALHNFLDARAEGNWAAACEYLSKGATEGFEELATQAKQVTDTSCGGILAALTNPAAKQSMKAEAEQANVGSLRIEDERAFVIYTGADGAVLAMPMANEGGDWKVTSLAGTPLR